MKSITCEQYKYVSLAGLRRVLNDLDEAHGRWWLEGPVVLRRRDIAFGMIGTIEVFHAKGGPGQVTDELSFLLPVTSKSGFEDDGNSFIWLEPRLIEPGIEGLYFENGRVLTDFIADWVRFWCPLKKAVRGHVRKNATAWRL